MSLERDSPVRRMSPRWAESPPRRRPSWWLGWPRWISGKASLTTYVRVPHEDERARRVQEVRTFASTVSAGLPGLTSCVMEATSSYWKLPFCLLADDIECQA